MVGVANRMLTLVEEPNKQNDNKFRCQRHNKIVLYKLNYQQNIKDILERLYIIGPRIIASWLILICHCFCPIIINHSVLGHMNYPIDAPTILL